MLTARSDRAGLAQLATHLGALALTGWGIAAGAPFWPALIPAHGVLLVFLFTAMHECVHRTAFATARLNDAVAAFCGVLLALPPAWFRAFHFAHHRHTQDPARDPELATPKPAALRGWLWHVSGLPLWASLARTLWTNAAGRCADPFATEAARPAIRREARAMLALYAALAAGSALAGDATLLWLWVIPALVGQPALRLYLLAEHGRCPFAADMFANSRTTFTNAALRRLAWNMPFHAEHHVFPAVPFHRLPALHALARGRLRVTAPGYAAFTADHLDALTAGERT